MTNRKIFKNMMFKNTKSKPINSIIKIFLIIAIITITTTSASVTTAIESNDSCPEECECTKIITDNNHLQNHVKCYDVDGLKEDGKNLSIHSLDLSNINLTRISNSLEKLKDLIYLNLSNNHLSEIGRFGKRIQKLNLSHNRITSGKLYNLPLHLKYLDLSYNDITYLPIELKNLKYLKSIELTGNKIHCSCETLEIRNWLQDNHVWTNNHIKCTYPIELKGKSWLQVRQSDVCNHQNASKNVIDNENELMLGDEPMINDEESSGEKEEFEELGKDYLPIGGKGDEKLSEYKAVDEAEIEGSGYDDLLLVKTIMTTTSVPLAEHKEKTTENPVEVDPDEYEEVEEEDEEASGGGEPLITIPSLLDYHSTTTEETVIDDIFDNDDGNETVLTNLTEDEDDENSTSILSSTPDSTNDIFGTGLGIVQFPTSTYDNSPSSSPSDPSDPSDYSDSSDPSDYSNHSNPSDISDQTASEEPVKVEKSASIKVPSEEVAEASSSENKNTYILLGAILIILMGLILYVGVKRNRARRRCRRQNDAENPKETELLDMDEKNLGKPINRNGAKEHVPLISDRTKSDLAKPVSANGKKVPYEVTKENDKNAQEPLLKNNENEKDPESKPIQTESNNNVPNSTLEKPTTISTDIKELPKAEQNESSAPIVKTVGNDDAKPSEPIHQSKYGAYPPPRSKPSSGDEGEGYHSSSPRPSRYSPVYSPETGRVKIKLTETPKPKTPLLVTRSRSNAGDIITTPASKIETSKVEMPNNTTATMNNNSTLTPTVNGDGQ